MDVLAALEMHDGVASWTELDRDGVSASALVRAVAAGAVARPHRGVYVLPGAFEPFAAARRLRGVVSHTSAAVFHGLDLFHRDPGVHVTVPRGRRKEGVPPGVVLHRRDLRTVDHLERWPVTSSVRTCLDCFRLLPLRDAVVLGDSALRRHVVVSSTIRHEAAGLKGAGSARARVAAELIDERHESPLESVASVEMYLAGLPRPEPQVVLETPLGPRRVDFWFPQQRVGVETDGFEAHGSRAGLLADCDRHNGFVLGDLLVLRFGYEHVVVTPKYFVETVGLALARNPPRCPRCDVANTL